VLLIGIVLSLESQREFLHGCHLLGAESEIKCVACFGHEGVVHRCALERESFVRNSIKACSRRHLAFVLEDNLHVVLFVDACASELKHWSSVSFNLFRFRHLQSWQSTFAPHFKCHLSLLGVKFAILDNSLKHTTVLLHFGGVETNSNVFMLIWHDAQ